MKKPKDFKELRGMGIMSNFDHQIDRDIEKAIKGQKLFSRYAGYNFNGLVWWDEKWYCEVWQYGSILETVSADTLEEIMEVISNEYGYE